MSKRRSTIQVMAASFLAIAALVIALGIGSIREVEDLAGLTEQIHGQSFTVSNALHEAHVGILKIRQHLLATIVAPSAEELERSVAHIIEHEADVHKHLETVRENFVGDPARVDELIETFDDWKAIRSEIVGFARSERREEARPLVMEQGPGGQHFIRLTGQMEALVEFARAKADGFLDQGRAAQDRGFVLLVLMILAVVIAIMFVFWVTTKKVNQAHGQLADSEKRLRLIMDGVPVGIAYVDRNERYQFVSKGFEALLGRRAKDIVGRTVRNVIPEQAYKKAGPNMKRALAGEKAQYVNTVITPDGRHVSIVVNYLPHISPGGEIAGYFSLIQDVTEQELAAEKLKASEARLRLIMDSVPVGISYIDRDERFQFASKGYEDLYGLRARDILGKTLSSIIDDRAYNRAKPNIDRTMAGEKLRHENIIYTADGHELSIIVDHIPDIQSNGEVRGLFAMIQDVTKQKQAEEGLRQYEHIVSSTTDMLALLDRDYVYLAVNPAYLRAFAKTSDQVIGHTAAEVFGDEFFDATIRPRAERSLAGENVRYEDWFEFPAGGRKFMDISISPYRGPGGDIDMFVVAGRDSTERKQAEEALRQSEFRYRHLIDSAEVSIWDEDFTALWDALEAMRGEGVKDLGRHLDDNPGLVRELAALIEFSGVNKATLKLFGGASEKDFLSSIDRTFTDSSYRMFGDELRAIWAGEDYFRSEVTSMTLAGKEIFVLISLPLPKTRAQAKSVPISVIDLTERKAMEAQLRQAQKMEAVGLLTGGIAHDFNNILSIVMGNLELLHEQVASDSEALDWIQKAMQGTDRGASLTKKLLGFSRRGARGAKLINLNEFVDNLHELMAKSLTPAIRVEIDIANDMSWVKIDADDFNDTLLNLALNARDAMPDGGVLRIQTADVVLDEDFAKANPPATVGEFVMISVADTGTGMTLETKNKVFEPFFTTKNTGEGSGLGLSMVYGFVERSGGHITIDTEIGQGTTVRIYLPRADAEDSVEAVEAARPDEIPRGTETVLVVDDEEALVDIAVTVLERLGYKVLTAYDGVQALKIVNGDQAIDLLFSDIIMPRPLNGYQLAEAALEVRPALKVLLTSGFTNKRRDRADGEPGLSSERTGNLLNKPYSHPQLAASIRRALDEDRHGTGRQAETDR